MRFRLMLFTIAFLACPPMFNRTAAQSLTFPQVDSPVLHRDHVEKCGQYVEAILASSYRTMGFQIPDDHWKTIRDLLYPRPYTIEEYATVKANAGRNQLTNLASNIASSYHPMIEPPKRTSIRQNQLAALSQVPSYQFLVLLSVYVDPAKESWYVPMLREVGEKTLREHPLRGDDARILVSLGRFLPMLGEPVLNHLFDAWEPAGGMDRWCREYLIALAHYRAGATGMSGRVGRDTAVREFALAEPHLLAAHRLAPSRPEPAAILGVIAGFRGETVGGKSMAEWFDASFRAGFDHPKTIALARDVLEIDPDGADRALMNFALSGAASEQWETRVPWEIIDIVRTIDGRRRDYRIYQMPGLWTIAQQMTGEGAASASRFVEEETLLQFVMEAAIGAREWEAAVEAVHGWSLHHDAQSYAPEDDLVETRSATRRPRYSERIFPHLTDRADELREADELVRDGKDEEALAIYRKVLESGIDHPYGRAFVANRIVRLVGELLYADGQWVSLQFEPGLPGWSLRGYFHQSVSDDGWLTMEPTDIRGNGNLEPLVAPAVPYEVEGEFKYERGSSDPVELRHELLSWGNSTQGAAVRISLGDQPTLRFHIGRENSDPQALAITPGVHRFHYRVEPNRLILTIDNREFVSEVPESGPTLRPTLRFLLNTQEGEETVAYRNIRLRQLPQ